MNQHTFSLGKRVAIFFLTAGLAGCGGTDDTAQDDPQVDTSDDSRTATEALTLPRPIGSELVVANNLRCPAHEGVGDAGCGSSLAGSNVVTIAACAEGRTCRAYLGHNAQVIVRSRIPRRRLSPLSAGFRAVVSGCDQQVERETIAEFEVTCTLTLSTARRVTIDWVQRGLRR